MARLRRAVARDALFWLGIALQFTGCALIDRRAGSRRSASCCLDRSSPSPPPRSSTASGRSPTRCSATFRASRCSAIPAIRRRPAASCSKKSRANKSWISAGRRSQPTSSASIASASASRSSARGSRLSGRSACPSSTGALHEPESGDDPAAHQGSAAPDSRPSASTTSSASSRAPRSSSTGAPAAPPAGRFLPALGRGHGARTPRLRARLGADRRHGRTTARTSPFRSACIRWRISMRARAINHGIGTVWCGAGTNTPSETQLELIEHLKPTIWLGMASYGLHLANLAEAKGFDLAHSTVKKIIVAAEPLSPVKREKLERAWGARGLRPLRHDRGRVRRRRGASATTACTSGPTSSTWKWSTTRASRCPRARSARSS